MSNKKTAIEYLIENYSIITRIFNFIKKRCILGSYIQDIWWDMLSLEKDDKDSIFIILLKLLSRIDICDSTTIYRTTDIVVQFNECIYNLTVHNENTRKKIFDTLFPSNCSKEFSNVLQNF